MKIVTKHNTINFYQLGDLETTAGGGCKVVLVREQSPKPCETLGPYEGAKSLQSLTENVIQTQWYSCTGTDSRNFCAVLITSNQTDGAEMDNRPPKVLSR